MVAQNEVDDRREPEAGAFLHGLRVAAYRKIVSLSLLTATAAKIPDSRASATVWAIKGMPPAEYRFLRARSREPPRAAITASTRR